MKKSMKRVGLVAITTALALGSAIPVFAAEGYDPFNRDGSHKDWDRRGHTSIYDDYDPDAYLHFAWNGKTWKLLTRRGEEFYINPDSRWHTPCLP